MYLPGEYRLQLANLKVPLDEGSRDARDLLHTIACRLQIASRVVSEPRILRRAVDARQKSNIFVVYTVEFTLTSSRSDLETLLREVPGLAQVHTQTRTPLLAGTAPMGARPLIVGAGPAGLFCALSLARYGYAPQVIERGDEVSLRARAVERFWHTGDLDPESNVQFGEGGAGTFSDGKLTTRIRDGRIAEVLEAMVAAGASPEILYEAKPHLGTDGLVGVVTNLRKEILRLGGELRFRTRLLDLRVERGRVTAAVISGPSGEQELGVTVLVLALGHSARDTLDMLHARGLQMEAKAFSVGARIEHEQAAVDSAQYGRAAGHPNLGAADYQLSLRDDTTGRVTYSFCMCPGGEVVAAASELGGVVTNGMSLAGRNSGIANSAIVVSVSPQDLNGRDPLRGISFQRELEARAYAAGGCDYRAPSQTVGDFLGATQKSVRRGQPRPAEKAVRPTYRPGVVDADLHGILPHDVCEHMERALGAFDKRLRGFAGANARLTGVETRTSCPVRLLRDESLQALGVVGLYPSGEGAGYAGGIMSAAVDGLRVAEAVIARYARPRSE